MLKVTKLSERRALMTNVRNNQMLARYLHSLDKAAESTPPAWFYEDLTDGELLELLRTEVVQNIKYTPEEYARLIAEDEQSALAKFGAQGGHPAPDQLLAIAKQGFEAPSAKPELFDSPIWKLAKARVRSKLPKANLRPLTPEQALEYVKTEGTIDSNGGWPTFGNRRILSVQQQALDAAKSGDFLTYPAIALYRTYRGKTRLVWMFPFSTNLQEARFAVPLQKTMRNMSSRSLKTAFSPWEGIDRVIQVVSDEYAQDSFLAASDFSATDAHFTHWCTEEVFDVFGTLFQEQFGDELRESMLHMHHIPLVVNSSTIFEGDHGVASGSFWTNLIETLFDLILSEAAALFQQAHGCVTDERRLRELLKQPIDLTTCNSRENVYSLLYAIGDDIAWKTHHYDERFAEFLELFCRLAGHEVKAEKTTNLRSSLKSLQRRYYRGVYQQDSTLLRADYPFVRAVNSLRNPERRFNQNLSSSGQLFLRSVAITDNCATNLGFEKFAEFVYRGSPWFGVYASGLKPIDERTAEAFMTNPLKAGVSYTSSFEIRTNLHRFMERSPTVQVWRRLAASDPALNAILEK